MYSMYIDIHIFIHAGSQDHKHHINIRINAGFVDHKLSCKPLVYTTVFAKKTVNK